MNAQTQSEQTLMELEREAYRRTMARDIAWMKALHAKDALMFSPGSEAKLASDVYDAALAQQPEQSRSESDSGAQTEGGQGNGGFFWEPVSAQVSASDDMGWVHGVITITDADGKQRHGKYVSVWVKENGQWKVAAEIRNNND
ncbi:YybH family protein [Ferrimonas marina]|uniref:DUF4440 domain-containing protein n=1 Tax=Ferrimonas marina TaxID=299255 RepID=A0A1M5N9Q4_9GAMM|nr:nuclear transport factor 2 family protein [Ferrimonas marina]SHG85929.1 protein of unknown function [Ferrimonas marina]